VWERTLLIKIFEQGELADARHRSDLIRALVEKKSLWWPDPWYFGVR
jgi:hypothetical protein